MPGSWGGPMALVRIMGSYNHQPDVPLSVQTPLGPERGSSLRQRSQTQGVGTARRRGAPSFPGGRRASLLPLLPPGLPACVARASPPSTPVSCCWHSGTALWLRFKANAWNTLLTSPPVGGACAHPRRVPGLRDPVGAEGAARVKCKELLSRRVQA